MDKGRKYLRTVFYAAIALLVFAWVWNKAEVEERPMGEMTVEIEARVLNADSMQLFYDFNERGFNGEYSQWLRVDPDPEFQTLSFSFEVEDLLFGLRLDPGTMAGRMEIRSMRFKAAYDELELNAGGIDSLFEFNSMCNAWRDTTTLIVESLGIDPYFSSRYDLHVVTTELLEKERPVVWPILFALLSALLCLTLLLWVDPAAYWHAVLLGAKPLMKVLFTLKGAFALAIAGLAYWLALISFEQVHYHVYPVKLILSGTFSENDNFQVYFAQKDEVFDARINMGAKVYGSSAEQFIEFNIPKDQFLHFIRLDLGTQQTCVQIDSLTMYTPYSSFSWLPEDLLDDLKENEHISQMELRNGRLEVSINGDDAHLRSKFNLATAQVGVMKIADQSKIPGYLALAIAFFAFVLLMSMSTEHLFVAVSDRADMAKALGFCVLISLPLISRVIPLEPEGRSTEKRQLASEPVLEAKDLLSYPDRFTNYYDDNFGFRKSLIRWNALVKGAGLKVSPKKSMVVFGKNDWMFYTGEGIIDFYRHASLFTPEQLQRIQRKLENRHQWLKEQGIDYYLTIPPLKGTIYPEYLPGHLTRLNEQSKLDQLVEHMAMHSEFDIIDMRPALWEAKKERQVYYSNDTHWNLPGAFIGYQVLAQRIAEDHPEIKPFELSYFTEIDEWKDNADLTNMIGLNDVFLRHKILLMPANGFNADDGPEVKYPMEIFFKYRPMFRENDSLQGPNLVMFRDSYTVYLKPFLSEHFHRSVFIWTPLFHADIVEIEQPDIVIHEMLERFIDDLLLDDPGNPRYEQ